MGCERTGPALVAAAAMGADGDRREAADGVRLDHARPYILRGLMAHQEFAATQAAWR